MMWTRNHFVCLSVFRSFNQNTTQPINLEHCVDIGLMIFVNTKGPVSTLGGLWG